MKITLNNVENYKKIIKSLDKYKLTHAEAGSKLVALCVIDKETGTLTLKTDFVPYSTMWYMLWMYDKAKNNLI